MEIETTHVPMNPGNDDIEMQDDQEDKSKYLSQLLGIKLNKEDLNLFQNKEELILLLNSIKFTDKKKNEIKEKISEEINNLQDTESFQKLSEDRNRKFSEIVKLKSKTIMYHTAENDELSDTMHAFYFCDKSKQIFSDKQTAEYKAIHFDPVYEYPLNLNIFGIKDEDNISSYSNLKNTNNQKEENKNSKLNKKRNKSKSGKKQSQEKMNNSDDYNNSKNEIVAGTQEEEYCIQNCKYSRKSKGQPMIMCDKCNRWYHTKCLSFTNEQFQKYTGKGKEWFCPICKMDVEDKND